MESILKRVEESPSAAACRPCALCPRAPLQTQPSKCGVPPPRSPAVRCRNPISHGAIRACCLLLFPAPQKLLFSTMPAPDQPLSGTEPVASRQSFETPEQARPAHHLAHEPQAVHCVGRPGSAPAAAAPQEMLPRPEAQRYLPPLSAAACRPDLRQAYAGSGAGLHVGFGGLMRMRMHAQHEAQQVTAMHNSAS